MTGIYFSELKASDAYMEINAEVVAGEKYENHPDTTQLLRVDEKLLSFVKDGILEYAETATGNLSVYASQIFKSILPIGSLLTDDQTGKMYEVARYFSKGSQWAAEDDF